MVSAPGCIWPRAYCRGVAGLGGAGARSPVGLIRSPAVLGLAVGLGDPWSHCWGVVVLGLAAGVSWPFGVAAGAGCESSCACVRVVGVDEAIKGH